MPIARPLNTIRFFLMLSVAVWQRKTATESRSTVKEKGHPMARIEVVLGAGKGWKYRIRAGDVRIGRAAGNNVKVQDPAWQDGYLHVRHVQGGYTVANHMPHPVFLDGEVLPEGEQRTWYHGARLQ